jgi:amino-acid N-acetyltransferase
MSLIRGASAPDVHKLPARVRAARHADLPAVLELLRHAGLPTDGVASQFPDAFAVVEADDSVVGTMGIETYAGNGLLRSAVVAPGWRERGAGHALLSNRLEWAATQGLGTVYLLTTSAERYFARHGFTTVDRDLVPAPVRQSCEFASACPASAVVMARRIATPAATRADRGSSDEP